VTVESVEAAVAAAVQASLPAAIDAANAGYGDGVHIPAIVTWRRGIVVDVEEVDITHFPTLAVGTYREDPQKVGEAAMWGSEIQCPVVVAFVMLGPNGPDGAPAGDPPGRLHQAGPARADRHAERRRRHLLAL
jgi:hypothetical protein